MSPFLWSTSTPVSDFWWCLLWISKPEWVALFTLGGGVRVIWQSLSLVDPRGRQDGRPQHTLLGPISFISMQIPGQNWLNNRFSGRRLELTHPTPGKSWIRYLFVMEISILVAMSQYLPFLYSLAHLNGLGYRYNVQISIPLVYDSPPCLKWAYIP